jgi:hypothetical protein
MTLALAIAALTAAAHPTPKVVLVKHADFIRQSTAGATQYFVRTVKIGKQDLDAIRKEYTNGYARRNVFLTLERVYTHSKYGEIDLIDPVEVPMLSLVFNEFIDFGYGFERTRYQMPGKKVQVGADRRLFGMVVPVETQEVRCLHLTSCLPRIEGLKSKNT